MRQRRRCRICGVPPEGTTLQGKVVVVTGASSGVGLATATALAALGAEVHAVSRRAVQLPGKFTSWQLDLADASAIVGFCEQLRARYRELHALIHCAGVLERKLIADDAVQDVDRHFAVIARAPALLTTSLLQPLRAGRADVVFVNSSAALKPAAGVAAYAMAKSALVALADALRTEENAHGLRVLTIYLGRTATTMQQKLAEQEGSAYDGDRLIPAQDVAQLIATSLALDPRTELTEMTLRPRLAPTRGKQGDGHGSN